MTLAAFTDAARERGFGPGQAARAYHAVFREGRWALVHVFDTDDLDAARATYADLVSEHCPT